MINYGCVYISQPKQLTGHPPSGHDKRNTNKSQPVPVSNHTCFFINRDCTFVISILVTKMVIYLHFK